jgi:regulator of RNase E activity RraB
MNVIESSTESDWDFYFGNVNGVLSSIMVDLAAKRCAPVAGKPWLLWTWVYMRSPRDDGLSSDEEAPTLYKIEDALTGLLGNSGAKLVGRITGGERREFYFYSPRSEDMDAAVEKVRETFRDYRFESGTQHDPAWLQYRDVLYPSDIDMQRIQNRRVVNVLTKRGDDHSIPRPVDHALYFRSPEKRKAFAVAAVRAGFAVVSEGHETDEGGRYFLNVVRTETVTLDQVDRSVLELFELAKQYDADYDGWGCEVQTNPADTLCDAHAIDANGLGKPTQ